MWDGAFSDGLAGTCFGLCGADASDRARIAARSVAYCSPSSWFASACSCAWAALVWCPSENRSARSTNLSIFASVAASIAPASDALVAVRPHERVARRPRDPRLQLRVELRELRLGRGGDLVLGECRRRRQPEGVEAAGDLRPVDQAVVPVAGPEAAGHERGGADRAAVEERELLRVRRVGEVEHRDTALVPGLAHHVAARDRHERPVVGDAVLLARLRDRQLVVAAEHHLPVDDVEDRVRAPVGPVGRRGSARRCRRPTRR